MNITKNLPFLAVVAVLGGGLAVVISNMAGNGDGGWDPADIRVPELSPLAAAGRAAFDAECAGCHGADGGGAEQGPPLIHPIYNPGHHGDTRRKSHRIPLRNTYS